MYKVATPLLSTIIIHLYIAHRGGPFDKFVGFLRLTIRISVRFVSWCVCVVILLGYYVEEVCSGLVYINIGST